MIEPYALQMTFQAATIAALTDEEWVEFWAHYGHIIRLGLVADQRIKADQSKEAKRE